MRYGPEHSEKTKNRVVKIAAAQMRKRGPDNVGVADVMSRAGLTHGGFYAHFNSKDDLIALVRRTVEAGLTDLRALDVAHGNEKKSPRPAGGV